MTDLPGVVARGIEPELWVDRGAEAVAFYRAAFDAEVLHQVGDAEDIVARLQIGAARFWVAATASGGQRLTPTSVSGATGRTLLVVDEPSVVVDRAVAAGAELLAEVADEYGWRLGRVRDPAGHEWEIGAPLEAQPDVS